MSGLLNPPRVSSEIDQIIGIALRSVQALDETLLEVELSREDYLRKFGARQALQNVVEEQIRMKQRILEI